MIERGYLRTFALSAVVLLALFFALTWVVDPYGVSPLRLAWPGINTIKPKRLAIDRALKPYEVWRDQPRTVFIGTSRFHEAFDPAVLNGTRFSPAYNASVPAAELNEMAGLLEQYFQFDKNLRVVFMELLFYHFLSPQPPLPPRRLQAFLTDITPLFFSASAVPDSLQTLLYNLSGRPSAYLAPSGYWVPPANKKYEFDQNYSIGAYVTIHNNSLKARTLAPAAFSILDRIVDLCRQRNAELVLAIAPFHPWDEYRLWSFDQWPIMEEWLRRVSAYQNVVSFSQYNDVVAEPVTRNMTYWNDPLHPSLRLGRLMLRAYLGTSDPDIPANLLRKVSPTTVEPLLRERRADMIRWIRENPDYPAAFERAKARFQASR
jgi:hypothetical protein